MLKKLILFISMSLFLFAYELPKLNLPTDKQPEIVIFDTQSLIVENKPSYKIRWKTIDATDINITFIGKVKPSGSMIITEDEYNRGPITLKASSASSSHIDIKTINKNVSSKVITPVFKDTHNDAYSDRTMPHRRRMNHPVRRHRGYR
ncbi:MAG: hypothetical protein JJW00_06400 [Sulfurimonas sp.]|nr:hypothetical protein [Sulfurimonas sp.]